MTDVQVVVIGGGPAGAAAAISARQYGLSVTLIEQQAFPRHRPGESLHPGVEPVLLQLGLTPEWLSRFSRFSGHWQEVGGDRHFQPFGRDAAGPWQGFHIPRAELDQKLLQVAAELGAVVIQPCKASAISPLANGYSIHTVAHGDITADIVIDASGARHWLSRQFNHAVTPYSQPLYARYGYVKHDSQAGYAPCFKADANRWLWTAAINNEQLHWTQLAFSGSPADFTFIENKVFPSKAKKIPIHLLKQPPVELNNTQTIGAIRGADVTWRKAEQCAGRAFFKVGDAGFVLDPASSHGVLKALMSGIYAAYMGSQLLQGRLSAEQTQECYQVWMDDNFNSDKKVLSDFYAGLSAIDN